MALRSSYWFLVGSYSHWLFVLVSGFKYYENQKPKTITKNDKPRTNPYLFLKKPPQGYIVILALLQKQVKHDIVDMLFAG